MAGPKPRQEPSTEEIIASISRLIAADDAAREPILGPVAEPEDILELTERLDDDTRPRPNLEPPVAAARPPELPPPRLYTAAEPEHDRDRLLSETAARAAASSLARLGSPSSHRSAAKEPPIGVDGRTVEDIVREALQPLLRSWLEAHLPAIVERLVREEIARLSGEAGLR
jgi:cell pole-organizing protein PopZ